MKPVFNRQVIWVGIPAGVSVFNLRGLVREDGESYRKGSTDAPSDQCDESLAADTHDFFALNSSSYGDVETSI